MMDETFQFTADYVLDAIWNGRRILLDGIDTITIYKEHYRCWCTKPVYFFYTGKTSNLTTPKITKQSLHFVGTETKKLQERYSLLVKQYLISKDAYYYWKGIEDQMYNENFLVATQPYNMVGNIENINNSDEIVFGYFTVASVATKRIFVNRPDAAFYFGLCYQNYEDPFKLPPPGYFLLLENGRWARVQESCVDCTLNDGVAEKPYFWIDY